MPQGTLRNPQPAMAHLTSRSLQEHPAAEPAATIRAGGHASRGPVPLAATGWVLGAILLLALAIRLFRLGSWSYWLDEVFTLIDAHQLHLVLDTYPLFYALERLVFETAGISETTARIVPAVLGAATPVLLYPWFRRFAGAPGAWIAVLLLVLSDRKSVV